MKHLLAPILCMAALASIGGCSELNGIFLGQSPLERFQRNIDTILADSIFTSTKCGIEIVSLDDNEVLYKRDEATLLRPASNMKLFTAAAALSALGTNYTYATSLYCDTTITDSILHGNVYFKGFGDPDFDSAQLADLISGLKAKKISVIDGNLVGDATYFDNINWGSGWMWDDEPSGFAAYNSPLTINRNCVVVTVTPGKAVGDTVLVSIDPPTQYVSLVNEATTAPDTTPSSLEVSRKFRERLNTITVKGSFPLGTKPETDPITVWDPEMYFMTLAREELQKQNISFAGKILLDTLPKAATLVSQHLQPIDSVITYLNKASDNLSAENTLKIIG
ncbi:MAG TPA: D-alanyl-D-alanine carboxypeptidase/D-alanyl-D-alanine-endopeptidase, partial [Bacteroidota bacterium]|nr:D-alanyl-D-alanine carboxypeptidase/D-alanyl-D-alanine-endopeptidase [Bacteroidota bacterium]